MCCRWIYAGVVFKQTMEDMTPESEYALEFQNMYSKTKQTFIKTELLYNINHPSLLYPRWLSFRSYLRGVS